MELYLIRHAESANNILQDQRHRACDPVLTETGHRQAGCLAEYLSDPGHTPAYPNGRPPVAGIHRLYTSPMHRALQTTRYLAAALGLTPEVWIELYEQGGIFLDHGGDEGMKGYPGKNRREMQDECPQVVLPPEVTDEGWWTGSYETHECCQTRAAAVADRLWDWKDRPEGIALITHGGFIDHLLAALLGLPGGEQFHFRHQNASLSRFTLLPTGRLVVHYLNRRDHLGDAASE